MTAVDVRQLASDICRELDQTENPEEWRQLSENLVPVLVEYWDVHPHSAMEMLEVTSMRLPVSLAHAVVRRVVLRWRKKDSYDPDAGGNADHCFLSALILSENFDLAESPWVERVLPYTLDKELKYPRFDRMRDGARKQELVNAVAGDKGEPELGS